MGNLKLKWGSSKIGISWKLPNMTSFQPLTLALCSGVIAKAACDLRKKKTHTHILKEAEKPSGFRQ